MAAAGGAGSGFAAHERAVKVRAEIENFHMANQYVTTITPRAAPYTLLVFGLD